jgi:hypothetical protein
MSFLLAQFMLSHAAIAADSPLEDEGSVLRIVIESEAGAIANWPDWTRRDRHPCLAPVASGYVFDDSGRGATSSEESRRWLSRLRAAEPGTRTWQSPQVSSVGHFVDPQLSELRMIVGAAADVIADRSGTDRNQPLRPQWATWPYRICDESGSRPTLSLTAPMIRAGIAFVRARFSCTLCGHEIIYALRRSSIGWYVVGTTTLWIG